MKSTVIRKTSDVLIGRRHAVEDLVRSEVRVGWSVNAGADPKTLTKAVVNTLGAPNANIPARDAITPTVVSQLDQIRSTTIEALRSRNPNVALEKFADNLQTEFKRTISAFSDPPNAPSTIKSKGRNDPLVDTGEMLDQAAAWVAKK